MGSAIALNLCGFRGVPRPLLITEFAHKAGVVVDADQAAIAAGFRVAAERRRPARSDGAHDPELSAAEMPGTDLAIDITVAAEHLRHFQDWCHDGSGRRLVLQIQPVEWALRIADRGVGGLRIA